MQRTARSVRVFGVYLLAIGILLLAVPDLLLGAFALGTTTEPWIRIVGLLAAVIGWYYLAAVRAGSVVMLRATIPPRCLAVVVFGALVALRMAAPTLLLFALVDLAGALWTAWALRADAREARGRAPTTASR